MKSQQAELPLPHFAYRKAAVALAVIAYEPARMGAHGRGANLIPRLFVSGRMVEENGSKHAFEINTTSKICLSATM
jgi:hypothetical protein